MAYNFPDTPTVGQIVTGPGGAQYKWDGKRWINVTTAATPPVTEAPTDGRIYGRQGSTATWLTVVTVGDSAPTFVRGSLWFDSTALMLYIAYDDGTSKQWIPVAHPSGTVIPLAVLSDEIEINSARLAYLEQKLEQLESR